MRLEIRVERSIYLGTYDLHLLDREGRSVATDITFAPMVEGAYLPDPPVRLDETSAQLLIDELWRAGLRPTEGTGSAGSLAATERHLKDMQRIAFAFLDLTAGGVGG